MSNDADDLCRPMRSPHVSREQSRCVLLLIDVLNHFDFDGSDGLLRGALRAAPKIAALKAAARKAGVPTVYVNDNFGRWRSDFRTLVRRCLRPSARGRRFVQALVPDRRDYFVLKPMNSGFYATTLEVLLRYLGAETLVLAGLSTDNCVLFTAHDAYLRDYRLVVPRDCSAACSTLTHRLALEQLASRLKADTRPASRLSLASLTRAA